MRRAMGKKDAKVTAGYKDKFIKQADHTIDSDVATKVFEQMEYFTSYAFNKSHDACYALISYQTAYLKCHYPKEYKKPL